MPQHGGAYAACVSQGVQQFASPPEYGQDITAEVLQGSGASMRYNIAGGSRSAGSLCCGGSLEHCCRTLPEHRQQGAFQCSTMSGAGNVVAC